MNKRVATTPLRGNNSRRRLDDKHTLSKITPPKLRHALAQPSPEAKIREVIVLVPQLENLPPMWQLMYDNYMLSQRLQREQALVQFLELERKFSRSELES